MKQIPKVFKQLILVLLVGAIGLFLFHAPAPKKPPADLSLNQPPVVAVPIPEIKIPFVNLSSALAGSKVDVSAIRVPILMYHHVGYLTASDPGIKYDQLAADLTVSPQDFEAQVLYFKALGYNPVSLKQVYESLQNGLALPSKPIVFTFDDGYKDVFDYAIPILQKYGYTGTFAIATSLLGRPGYAVWNDVVAAQNMGMEIVSHTENHLDLTNPIYSDADLYREIFDSKALLEQKLGIPVDFFVYPYGQSNQKVVDLVGQAGYKMALTTAFGTHVNKNSLLMTPRVRVHGQDGLDKLKQIFSPTPHIVPVPTNP